MQWEMARLPSILASCCANATIPDPAFLQALTRSLMLNARQNSPHQADLPTLAFPANPRLDLFCASLNRCRWSQGLSKDLFFRHSRNR